MLVASVVLLLFLHRLDSGRWNSARCDDSLQMQSAPHRLSKNDEGDTPVHQEKKCQLNHAGASPSPQTVIDRITKHMELEKAAGAYSAASIMSDELDLVYTGIAELIDAPGGPDEIALTESATVAWTRAFYSMAEFQQQKEEQRDVILVCDAEYVANMVAACQFAKKHDWTVLSIPSSRNKNDGSSTGRVDPAVLQQILSGSYEYSTHTGSNSKQVLDPARISMVCITHVPTNSGIVNPIEDIGTQILEYNRLHSDQSPILYLVDACQSIGHLNVSVRDVKCDALVATGRKYLRGPRGTGFLYMSLNLVNQIPPSHVDHFGAPVTEVPTTFSDGDSIQDLLTIRPKESAKRFEFWESNVGNRLGLGEAVKVALSVGTVTIADRIQKLSNKLRTSLVEIPGIHVHHVSSSTCGITTLHSTQMDSKVIKERLYDMRYELSVVPATSTPLDSARCQVPDLVRVALSYTTDDIEIDEFLRDLKTVVTERGASS